jgi:hypothetical protein
MHDGYLFTIGICGSTSGVGPAFLDRMLAALAPVKRAAYLGEVTISTADPDLRDPYLDAILADIADAEIMLLVTPMPEGVLPRRLQDLLQSLERRTEATGTLYGVIVVLGSDTDTTALAERLRQIGVQVVGTLAQPTETDPDYTTAQMIARQAYDLARTAHPYARPDRDQ